MKEEIFNDFRMIISKSSEKVISSQNWENSYYLIYDIYFIVDTDTVSWYNVIDHIIINYVVDD